MTAIAGSRTRPAEGESRFVIHNLGWGGYQTLLDLFGERSIRVTYDRGNAELMSPLLAHERYRSLLGYMVEAITDELDLPRVAAGATTFKSEALDRGIEPDECYYLANAGRLRGTERIDLTIDPPPDLAIEIEITSSVLDRLGIYAALGIPEVWRFDGRSLEVLLLQPDGAYVEGPTSAAFPFLPMGVMARFLREHDGTNDTRWARGFRAWVRDEIVPRGGEG